MSKLSTGFLVEPEKDGGTDIGEEIDKDCYPEYPGKVTRVLSNHQYCIVFNNKHSEGTAYHCDNVGRAGSSKGTELGHHEL